MAGWRIGVRTCIVRCAENAGFDLDLDDILVMFACCLFSWGRGWRLRWNGGQVVFVYFGGIF
jgi:hypothetical protein